MNDKKFEEMDKHWMKKTEALREKPVSEGILKGFSASVERRLGLGIPAKKAFRRPAWAPALAVLVIASVLVSSDRIRQTASSEDLQDEIETLKDLGAWDEQEDQAVLGDDVFSVPDDLA